MAPTAEVTAPASTASTGSATVSATESAPVSADGCLGSADKAIVDLNCREITIAVENAYPPFNYVSVSTGQPAGWDYETFTEICTRLHCKPVFKEVAWESLIQSVANKLEDLGANGITITDDRKQIVDFSTGYIQIDQHMLVRKGETRFTGIDDFVKNDKLVVGVQSGTTNYETAKKYLPESRIKAFDQMPFVVQALISGDVDAMIIDQVVGLGYTGTNADQVELIGDKIVSDELGFVYPKGSDLVDPINKAIAAMQADGWFTTTNQKYFSSDFKVE
jgi:polar amino acid transport system substrate-binding protein